MTTLTVPARLDPCWERSDWRTETLRSIAETVGRERIGELTGAAPTTVRFWLSPKHPTNIPVNSLRLLLLELRVAGV